MLRNPAVFGDNHATNLVNLLACAPLSFHDVNHKGVISEHMLTKRTDLSGVLAGSKKGEASDHIRL
jgi:hypothetical protein